MKLRRRQRESNETRVNLTPLIDTVFLLLIFFMMTTTFNKQSQITVALPQAKGDAVTEQQDIRVIVDAKGEFSISVNDGAPQVLINTNVDTIVRALKEASGGNNRIPLLISADASAPHQAVMKVMQAARDIGLVRLSFEAQRPPE